MSPQDRLDALTEQHTNLTARLVKVSKSIEEIKAKLFKEKLGIPSGVFYIKYYWHKKPVVYMITYVSMVTGYHCPDNSTLVGHDISSKPVRPRQIVNINKHISEYADYFEVCSKVGRVLKSDSLKAGE